MLGEEENKLLSLKKKFNIQSCSNMDSVGIYAIINMVSGHIYVGQTGRGFKFRKYEHFRELRRRQHYNKYLQNAYDCYGEDNFKFVILEIIEENKLLDKIEQHWIDELEATYNIVKDIQAWRKLYVSEILPNGYYIKHEESFLRPNWHKWVYGGYRNPNI